MIILDSNDFESTVSFDPLTIRLIGGIFYYGAASNKLADCATFLTFFDAVKAMANDAGLGTPNEVLGRALEVFSTRIYCGTC